MSTPMNPTMKTYLTVDGGCRNNGNPFAKAYGSARIQIYLTPDDLARQDPVIDKLLTSEFPDLHTNNTAEIRALRMGLEWLLHGHNFVTNEVMIQTDSANLYGWIAANWKRNNPDCRRELAEVDRLLQYFSNCHIVKVPRAEIVKLLGH